MIDNNISDGSEEEPRQRELKTLFIRGILFFYAINLTGVLLGLIGIRTLGRARGMAFMLATIAALQVISGYVTLKLGDTV